MQHLKSSRFDQQFFMEPLIMRFCRELADDGLDLTVQRMLRRQIFRHQQPAIVDRLQIFLPAGIVGGVLQHRKSKQNIVVKGRIPIVLTDRMDRLRVDKNDIPDRQSVFVVADGYADHAVGHIDDLHLLVPVMGDPVDVLRQDPRINDIGKAGGSVDLCFLIS